MYREGWTEDQQRQIEHLERVGQPTDIDRGSLAALRITAVRDSERLRAQTLAERWRTAS